jgi:hypothetical protein
MRIDEASSGGKEYRSGAMRAKDNSFSISRYERQQQIPRRPDKKRSGLARNDKSKLFWLSQSDDNSSTTCFGFSFAGPSASCVEYSEIGSDKCCFLCHVLRL